MASNINSRRYWCHACADATTLTENNPILICSTCGSDFLELLEDHNVETGPEGLPPFLATLLGDLSQRANQTQGTWTRNNEMNPFPGFTRGYTFGSVAPGTAMGTSGPTAGTSGPTTGTPGPDATTSEDSTRSTNPPTLSDILSSFFNTTFPLNQSNSFTFTSDDGFTWTSSQDNEQSTTNNPLFDVFRNIMFGNSNNMRDYIFTQEQFDAVVSQLMDSSPSQQTPAPSQFIQQLPNIQITSDQIDAGLDCAICHEKYVLDENVIKLDCDHIYHRVCLVPWLEVSATCPICRQDVLKSWRPTDQSQANELPGSWIPHMDPLD